MILKRMDKVIFAAMLMKDRVRALVMTLLILLLTVGIATVAEAVPITFNFTATLTIVTPQLSSQFAIGQTVTGTYTFESTTADSIGNSLTGLYNNAITAVSFDINGYAGTLATGGINKIQIGNTTSDSYFATTPFAGASVNGLTPSTFEVALNDPTGTAFASDALPISPPNLTSFSLRQFDLVFRDSQGGGHAIFGQVNSLTIPEPSSLLLLCFGLVGLHGVRRRKLAI